jgi:type I restriction enzyme S subunit
MTPSDVKIVADNINDFIEVPEGLTRLRKALLTLAMSGNLVPQIENEGTAEDLLIKIQVQRKKVLERKKKKSDSIPLSAEEIPFSIPESWKWVRINEIGQVVGGGTPSTSKSSYFTEPTSPEAIPWLSPADMRKQKSMYVSHGRQSLTADGYKNSSATLMPKGSVIFSSRAPIGYVGIASNPLSTNQGFKSIVPDEGICSEYVYWYLLLRADDINARAPGTTFKEISGTSFAKEVFALPPTSEQKRIVDKVEEVMQQLDELEVKKIESDEIRTRLTRSAMQALGSADSKIALEQLSELVKTPQDIKELENAILTLAVSGMIVSQNKNEGTAEEIYSQINTYREAQENGGIRKKKLKNLPLITPEEIPFAIPESWRWVCIGEVSSVKGGKRLPKGSGFADRVTKHPYIRITDMKNGSVNTTSVPYISDEVFEKISRYTINSKDVYVTIAGTIGDAGKIPVELDGANLTENAAKIEFKFIDLDYFVLVLRSTPVKAQFLEKVVQMAQPKLALHRIESSIIPLPPLAEQKRIVKKVEELTILINQLKKVIA